MSAELAKRSYVSALHNPHWQNRFKLHMHNSRHGQNGSQEVTPVVTAITTENASPKTHIRDLKRSCRNKIRQWLEEALFGMVPDSKILPQNMMFPWEYPAGSKLGRWHLEPGTPSWLCPIRRGRSKDVVLHSKMEMVGNIAQIGYFFFLFFVYRGNCSASFVKTCVQSD